MTVNCREALAALAGLAVAPNMAISPNPRPGDAWLTWNEAAADTARFERNGNHDHRRLNRLGVAWLEPYRAPGVIRWHDDVSLVFATSNHDGDVSDLLTAAVRHFHAVGVTVLGHAITPCRSVGCMFVWKSEGGDGADHREVGELRNQ